MSEIEPSVRHRYRHGAIEHGVPGAVVVPCSALREAYRRVEDAIIEFQHTGGTCDRCIEGGTTEIQGTRRAIRSEGPIRNGTAVECAVTSGRQGETTEIQDA